MCSKFLYNIFINQHQDIVGIGYEIFFYTPDFAWYN